MYKFLYLAAIVGTEEPLSPPEKIDTAWHYFILFTKDYAAFCNRFFGRFIHHQPFVTEEDVLAHLDSGAKCIDRAKALFGELSSNWTEGQTLCGKFCSDCKPQPNPPGYCMSN
jgi:hypothetical protein